MNKEEFISALENMKKERERKFDQTVDLIINLKDIDLKKMSINFFVTIPHPFKKKKICAFLEAPSESFDKVITKADFAKWKTKAEIKKLVREYDFFVAQASLMPAVAATFGKALGPSGKMPSPQLGILPQATEKMIKELKEKVNEVVKIRAKEPSIKLSIGKQSMKAEEVFENAFKIYNEVINVLPNKKENIKSVLIKLTMSKPYSLTI